jgi:hypothetical protein
MQGNDKEAGIPLIVKETQTISVYDITDEEMNLLEHNSGFFVIRI